jgi:hypothetical protein
MLVITNKNLMIFLVLRNVILIGSVSDAHGAYRHWRCIILAVVEFLVFNPPIAVATQSKMWVCGRLLTGFAGSKLGGINICLLLCFCVCCKAEVSATVRSFVQRNHTLCVVPECDLDTSTMRRPTPTRPVERRRKVCHSVP